MRFNDLSSSWNAWLLIRTFDYRFLPHAGGLLDQPEWLMGDMVTLEGLYNSVKKMLEPPKSN